MATAESPTGVIPQRARSQWARAWETYRANRLALVSLGVCALLVLAAISAPLIAPYGYAQTDYDATLAPPGTEGHLFGTDRVGRDFFSGVVAAYRGGRADQLLMGITDVMFAFPAYLFTIILVTVMGQSLFAVGLAIGIASWVTLARLVRGQIIALKVREYVEAGRAMGADGVTIAVRYLLPNAVGPILVALSFAIPAAIIAEAGLALLGLGVSPPTPSWGAMIADGKSYVLSAPHVLIPPTVLFGITVLAFSWVGDGLRDAFDVGES